MRSAPSSSRKFVYDDFRNFPNDGRRHEIIGGEHHVTPSPDTKHQRIVTRLAAALHVYLIGHPLGEVFVAPFDVVFSDSDIVEPDLLYVSRERAHVLTDEHVRGAPDLVVEVLSPGTRKTDEITKRKLYDQFEVREYWMVDPELDMIKVYQRPADGDHQLVRVAELSLENKDVLATPLLPEFSVPLADILAPPF